MPGIDTTNITPDGFTNALNIAQNSRVEATFILADLWHLASTNPQYDDLFHQVHNDSKVALSTVKKYRSTVDRFPYDERHHDVSIEAYYTVKNCDDITANNLLSQYADGRIENREQLRQAVREANGQPDKPEPIKTTCRVIDLVKHLTQDYGLNENDVIDITAKIAELEKVA